MKFIDFISRVEGVIFTLQELKNTNINVYPYQLTSWAKKGYINKLKNGIYSLNDKKIDIEREHVSFKLYEPSYISLEWALSVYGIIPDMVYGVTAVTSKITRTYKNNFGLFVYKHIKSTLYTGYKKININNQPYLIAEPEKALIDYIYLNSSKINNKEDLSELRLNELELRKLNVDNVNKYCLLTGSKKVKRIIKMIYV